MTFKSFRQNKYLRYFLSPFIFIALFGPAIIEANYNMIDNQIYHREVNSEFKNLILNEYNYAFTSYTVQLFVLYLAIVFLSIESLSCFIKLYHDDRKIKHDRLTNTVIIFFVMIVVGFFWALAYGGFASYRLIDLYLKRNEIKLFGFIPIPPIQSKITIARLIIIPLYGVVFSRWKSKVFASNE